MRVIAVMNQKGGVGKTTTAINIAHAFALEGRSVLTLDLDPQAHLTASIGAETPGQPGMDSVFLDGASIAEVSVPVREKLSLVPAGNRLADVERLTKGGTRRGYLLQEALSQAPEFDVVLVDCPPSSGLLTMNALLASTELLVPVSGDYLALHGLSRLMEIIRYVEQRLMRARRKWVVLTRFHPRRRLAQEVHDKLLQHFPGQVLATPIRETVALAESPSFGKTIFEYQANGNGAMDYRALASDLLEGRTC